VDSLDTLWIMGLKGEFEEAVDAVKDIDFSDSPTGDLNVFETTIRYLGGFLAAYDISGGKYPVLLEKATEVGELLYVAFDTPNRMPVLRWNWPSARDGKPQVAGDGIVVAELGSLSVEFTRLSQLTGNPRFYDAVQRITDALERNQNATRLPGLWPVAADTKNLTFSLDNRFTFGAMADSLYEYLPKEYLLLGGRCNQYKEMYERVIEVGKKELFFRPRTPHGDDILLSGQAVAGIEDKLTLMPEGQHLTCFVGGMVAMAAKIFNRPDEVEIGRKLTEGCVWAYNSTPTGIMPENFMAEPCYNDTDCVWSPRLWFQGPEYEHLMDHELERKGRLQGLIPGFRSVYDRRYLLRYVACSSPSGYSIQSVLR
jgi:mannosyl-oligosaccharide alpha-1,2-mannosidase